MPAPTFRTCFVNSTRVRGYLQSCGRLSQIGLARSLVTHSATSSLFAMRSALQHIRDDRRSRGRVWSIPVSPLEPPMPLTSRRSDELEEPRLVDLSDGCYMDNAMFPLVYIKAEHLPVRCRSYWAWWNSPSRRAAWTFRAKRLRSSSYRAVLGGRAPWPPSLMKLAHTSN